MKLVVLWKCMESVRARANSFYCLRCNSSESPGAAMRRSLFLKSFIFLSTSSIFACPYFFDFSFESFYNQLSNVLNSYELMALVLSFSAILFSSEESIWINALPHADIESRVSDVIRTSSKWARLIENIFTVEIDSANFFYLQPQTSCICVLSIEPPMSSSESSPVVSEVIADDHLCARAMTSA